MVGCWWHFLIAGKLRQSKCADDAARRSAEDEAGRFTRGLGSADGAAVGLHNPDGNAWLATGVGQGVGKMFQVAAYEREQVGVDDGRGGALILAVFGQNVAAERDGKVRTGAAQDLLGAAFMLRISKAVKKADSKTLGCGGGDLRCCADECLLVKGSEDIAVNIQSLDRLETQSGRDQWDGGAAGRERRGGAGSGGRSRMTSTNPLVVSRAVRAPCRSSKALVAMVVPCTSSASMAASTAEWVKIPKWVSPARIARLWLAGVVASLCTPQAAILQQYEIGECSANIDSNQGSGHSESS